MPILTTEINMSNDVLLVRKFNDKKTDSTL